MDMKKVLGPGLESVLTSLVIFDASKLCIFRM